MCQVDKSKKIDALFELIASITDPADCKALFQDLCTAKEIENMAGNLFFGGKTIQFKKDSKKNSNDEEKIKRYKDLGIDFEEIERFIAEN